VPLNHLHIHARDVATSREFYERYFGFEKAFEHGDGVFLTDRSGFLLAIDPAAESFTFPGWFHLGFMQDTPDAVRELHGRMCADGVPIARDLVDLDGAVVFYAEDPAGTRVEVSWYGAD